MNFSSTNQIIKILDQQWPDCLVQVGREFMAPKAAADIAAAGGYIGVGHHRCIRYLKPITGGLWLGGSHTTKRLTNKGRAIGPGLAGKRHIQLTVEHRGVLG